MIIKAKIFQIVKWEDKEKYFYLYMDFGREPVDLLHLQPIDKEFPKWYQQGFFGLFRSLFKSNDLIFKYHNMVFHQKIVGDKQCPAYEGLPILIKRPNNYKVGDIIELSLKINKRVMGV